MDLTGQVLKNRYQVESYLGRGGMAEVYKAYDTRRSYPVAIKVMHADLAEDYEFVRRFRQEAESLATLAHENIVRFYSFEKEGVLIFLVMDYVEGVTLRRLIAEQEQGLSLGQIQHIFPQMCQALHYAHEEGFIHRDVKPGNIMIRSNGQVLVTDFGIAKASDSATLTTYMPGTPAYMSPEQCLADEAIDRRSDLYALGIVLYEITTGQRPFIGETDSVVGTTREKIRWEQINLAPPSPQQYNPTILSMLAHIILKTLHKNPADRFATVIDLLDSFEIAMADVSPIIPTVKVNRITASTHVVMPTPAPVNHQKMDHASSMSSMSIGLLSFGLVGTVGTIVLILVAGWLLLTQQNGSSVTTIITDTPTHTATFEPTYTSTPTLAIAEQEVTPIPEPETMSPINGSATIIKNTTLHGGPSDLYPRFGQLTIEAVVEVTGRNKKGTWWQIIYPTGPNGRAWIDADEADINIDSSQLPVILDVPPLPTKTHTPTVTPVLKPTFGEIIFALDANGYDPRVDFNEGVIEIHAIFDYQGVSETDTWERVWYRNEIEILRNSMKWSGQESGRFDYFLDASGEPLPNGNWMLELYVENQLMVTGSFTIGQYAPVPLPPRTATPTITSTPTDVPLSEPLPMETPSENTVYRDTSHLTSLYKHQETVFLSTDEEEFKIIVAVQSQNGDWQKGLQLFAHRPGKSQTLSAYSTDYPSIETPSHPTITRYGNIEISDSYIAGYWRFYLIDETGQQVSEDFEFEYAGDAKIWLFFKLVLEPK